MCATIRLCIAEMRIFLWNYTKKQPQATNQGTAGYCISCSKPSNRSSLKKSRRLIFKPSQIFFKETTPGF